MQDYKNPKLILESSALEPGKFTWQSPSNLAIIKYWGKHGRQLPQNPSISFTLNSAVTQTQIEYKQREEAGHGVSLEFFFHGEPKPEFGEKQKKFLESILDIFPFLNQMDLTIRSGNSFPHSSGIASSASSMSALALCLCSIEDKLFGTLSDDEAFDRKASYVARLGSGSACRSVYGTMALWGKFGEVEGSDDTVAIPMEDHVHPLFKTFHDDILIVSKSEKSVSSRAGHGLMEQNPFAAPRYQQANQRLHELLPALRQGDLETFGRITENEALSLHALMMTSNPSYILMQPNTLEMINRLRAFREDTGHPVYFSLDAGPNLHVLYPEDAIHAIRPFIEEELVPLCEEDAWLPDWVGEGPEEL
ncbi:MAG: diphosphomevalonate decarboxylase [Bacteroidetes bacterium]|nr:diphosphomevalonate decarboxylase [Bacteroidota bacterium]